MAKRLFALCILAAVLTVIFVPARMSAAQQRGANVQNPLPPATSPAGSGGLARGTRPTGPMPRLADGKPDLSGVWNGGGPIADIAQGLAYSRPFKLTFTARLMPGEELMEYICQENNQDVQHIQGPARVP